MQVVVIISSSLDDAELWKQGLETKTESNKYFTGHVFEQGRNNKRTKKFREDGKR